MFEKEAEEYIKEHTFFDEEFGLTSLDVTSKTAFKDGAEFGYNKANEWHYVKDELPRADGYYLVFNKGSRSVIIGMFTDGHFEGCFPIAWKEIVLPKESE